MTFGLVAVVAEGTARIIDARSQFRSTLLAAYRAMEASAEPLRASRLELPPEPAVAVRAPAGEEGPPVPYVLGGRAVEGARPSTHFRTVVPAELQKDGRRSVFIVGESAGFGFPYAYAQSFGALLNDDLRSKGLTVLNASQVGATSADLAPVVARIVSRFDPKALILFMGNNEWIQWLPPQATPVHPSRIRFLRALANSRALAGVQYLLLKHAIESERSAAEQSGNADTVFRPHAEISGHTQTLRHPADDTGFDARSWAGTKRAFLEAFEENLTRMVRAAQERKIRVVLMTLPFNHKLSPCWKHPQPESFDSAHSAETRAAIHSAAKLVETRSFQPALATLDAALALDPLPPVLHYLRAEALEGLGRPVDAEQAYAQSRENMIGNLGSRLSVNEAIRRVAASTHADLVDVEQIFETYEHARGHYDNEELIHDDCHPTPQGQRLIAEALARLF